MLRLLTKLACAHARSLRSENVTEPQCCCQDFVSCAQQISLPFSSAANPNQRGRIGQE
jgi:hypothetical protein